MGAERVKVRIEGSHVGFDMRHGLCAVYNDDRSRFVRRLRDFFDIVCDTEHIAYVRNGHDLCAASYLCRNLFVGNDAAFPIAFQIDELCALRFCHHLPRKDVRMVFHNRNGDFVALAYIRHAVGISDEVQRFACVPRKNHFTIFCRVYKAGDGMPRIFVRFGRTYA